MRKLNAATVLATSLLLVTGTFGAATSASASAPSAAPRTVSSAVGQLASASTTDKKPGQSKSGQSKSGQSKSGQKKNGQKKPGQRGGKYKPQPAPLKYTPQKGMLVNNPLAGAAARFRIRGHLVRTIDSVPGREKIRIASWNVRSGPISAALIRAHNRGVSVRVVMDRLNANKNEPNPDVTALIRAFKKKEASRSKSMTSGLVRCVSACRGPAGIAHTKFFLFSKAGKAKEVVIYGSNNATDLAAVAQWNDVFTMTGKAAMYDEFENVFNEMRRDKNVAQPYLSYEHGKFRSQFFPYRGAGTEVDPLLADLNLIACQGATGGTGTNGNTKIRIAQTSMHGPRGKAIATKLAQMYAAGCDIKIVYAVFGNEVLNILRHTPRGAVPLRQIVQDYDIDGVYDKYLHMKNMAVSGVYNGNTAAQVTWNGSANWTGVALVSDEIVMRIFGSHIRKQYSDWVDYLFSHPPRVAGRVGLLQRLALTSAVARGVDPYSKIQVN